MNPYGNPYAMAPYVGACGPSAFDALALQREAFAGAVGRLAPVTLIGLGDDCPPLLPPTTAFVASTGATVAAQEGDICEACCSAQACFCVTKITIPNCGPCIFLLTSIKSGLCELLQCGSVMADSFYCDCDPPPLKTTMISPGIEFCITAQNVNTFVVADGSTIAAVDAARAARALRFRATLYGISTDEPCRPCLEVPWYPPAQIPPPVYTPPPPAQIPRPVYTPPFYQVPLNPPWVPQGGGGGLY